MHVLHCEDQSVGIQIPLTGACKIELSAGIVSGAVRVNAITKGNIVSGSGKRRFRIPRRGRGASGAAANGTEDNTGIREICRTRRADKNRRNRLRGQDRERRGRQRERIGFYGHGPQAAIHNIARHQKCDRLDI